ncbi:hypothetical protein TNCV_2511301, partial [Trichonephila clavipes]
TSQLTQRLSPDADRGDVHQAVPETIQGPNLSLRFTTRNFDSDSSNLPPKLGRETISPAASAIAEQPRAVALNEIESTTFFQSQR